MDTVRDGKLEDISGFQPTFINIPAIDMVQSVVGNGVCFRENTTFLSPEQIKMLKLDHDPLFIAFWIKHEFRQR